MMISPGVLRPWNLLTAETNYMQSPNAETKLRLEYQQAQTKLKLTVLGIGALGNFAAILIYARKKRSQI